MLPYVEGASFRDVDLAFCVAHATFDVRVSLFVAEATFGAPRLSLLVECTTCSDVRVSLSWRAQHLVIYWSAFEGHTGPVNSTPPNVFATGVGGSQLWDGGI